MTPLEGFLFGYTYCGGSPPPTYEALLLRHPGDAQYVTGHSWPRQPPFDEIGVYRRPLQAGEWEALRQIIDAAYQSRSHVVASRVHADSGSESLVALREQETWQLSWNPNEPPEPLLPLLEAIRNLISDLRQHPLSVLRGTLELSAGNSAGRQIALRLSNRGSLPFTLYGFEPAQTGQGGDVRLGFYSRQELESSRSRSPIQLLRLPPVLLSAGATGGSAEMEIEPGGSRLLTVANPKAILERHARGEAGALFALVHVFWKAAGSDPPLGVQEGWLMPQCLPLDAGAGQQATA